MVSDLVGDDGADLGLLELLDQRVVQHDALREPEPDQESTRPTTETQSIEECTHMWNAFFTHTFHATVVELLGGCVRVGVDGGAVLLLVLLDDENVGEREVELPGELLNLGLERTLGQRLVATSVVELKSACACVRACAVVRIALVKGRSDEVVDVGKEDSQDRHVDAAVCDHDTRYVSVRDSTRGVCAVCACAITHV
jgi:hypothetical protein